MPGELLLDTGALVSLLDRSQTHHLKCRRAFADWTGPVHFSFLSSMTSLQRVRKLLDKFADLPMDFADCHARRAGRRARLHLRVHDGLYGLLGLPSQGPEAISYRPEGLNRPDDHPQREATKQYLREESDDED